MVFCHLEGANLAGCRGWAGREFKAGFSDSVIAILQYFVHVAISKDSWGGVFLSQLVPRVLVCKSVSRGGSPSESENPPSRREHTFRLDSSGIARHATFACSRYLSILLDGPRLSALCIFGEVSKNLSRGKQSGPTTNHAQQSSLPPGAPDPHQRNPEDPWNELMSRVDQETDTIGHSVERLHEALKTPPERLTPGERMCDSSLLAASLPHSSSRTTLSPTMWLSSP
jgi:hypothetical protein